MALVCPCPRDSLVSLYAAMWVCLTLRALIVMYVDSMTIESVPTMCL